MLTKVDIKKLIEVFATKQDLRRFEEKMVTREEFDLKFDNVINKLDAVYGEVKDFRQKQSFHQGQHDRINEDISTIKDRVDKIETPKNPN